MSAELHRFGANRFTIHAAHRISNLVSRRPGIWNLQQFSTNQPTNDRATEHTPITIIGGGPSGLLLSILLSTYNVPSTLFERKTESQLISHPQAHFINLRTMEILRHCTSPNVMEEIWKSVPPLEQWQDFRFGHSVLGCREGKGLGVVRHPVADGGSGPDGGKPSFFDEISDMHDSKIEKYARNSVCNVAHLGQHKFCHILIDEAKRAAKKVTNGETTLNFDTNIEYVQDKELGQTNRSNQAPLLIHPSGFSAPISTNYVVATEGAHSPTREHHGISMIPNPDLHPQNLMNVHFKVTSPDLIKKLSQYPAMLYFIYNEVMISVFICHDMGEGNWVLQIPFIPPYQSPPNEKECHRILHHGLLGDDPNFISSTSNSPFEIISIRPWIMTASIAERYLIGPSHRIILAGDSAHTFPPAGGFGMNTSLQDVHNLAWRLALLYTNDEHEKNSVLSIDKSALLDCYERERRPVAQQNEALSVRNYNRTVKVARTLGLDIRLAQFANQVMTSFIGTYVPISVKKVFFENAFKLALRHLVWFRDGVNGIRGNLLGLAMVRELKTLLKKGEGLPLVFPNFEIGFRYGNTSNVNFDAPLNDTGRYAPSINIGCRMPHLEMEIEFDNLKDIQQIFPNLKVYKMHQTSYDKRIQEGRFVITLTDIASQLRQNLSQPCFSVLLINLRRDEQSHDDSSKPNMPVLKKVLSQINIETGIRIEPVEILCGKGSDQCNVKSNHLILRDTEGVMQNLIEYNIDGEEDKQTRTDHCIILVRPDGHIALMSQLNARLGNEKNILKLKNDVQTCLKINCGVEVQ